MKLGPKNDDKTWLEIETLQKNTSLVLTPGINKIASILLQLWVL